jgi:hypothetical protein
MADIPFDKNSSDSFRRLFKTTKDWAGKHQLEIGGVEMAVGGALVYWAVQNGLIEMGKACATPAQARRRSQTSDAGGQVLHKLRGRKPRRRPR